MGRLSLLPLLLRHQRTTSTSTDASTWQGRPTPFSVSRTPDTEVRGILPARRAATAPCPDQHASFFGFSPWRPAQRRRWDRPDALLSNGSRGVCAHCLNSFPETDSGKEVDKSPAANKCTQHREIPLRHICAHPIISQNTQPSSGRTRMRRAVIRRCVRSTLNLVVWLAIKIGEGRFVQPATLSEDAQHVVFPFFPRRYVK